MEQFIPKFNEKNKILVNKLGEEVGKGEFDVIKYIEAMNLDLICSKFCYIIFIIFLPIFFFCFNFQQDKFEFQPILIYFFFCLPI
jgi:hypothetical protein